MFFTTVKSLFQLSLLIFVGIFAAKKGLIKKEGVSTLNGVLMHVSLPATLFCTFQMDSIFENKGLLVFGLAMGFIFFLISIGSALLLVRNNPNAGSEQSAIAFNNITAIGIPLLTSMCGPIGTFYASVINFMGVFFMFSVCPTLVKGKFDLKEFIKLALLNDKMIVCIFAFILIFLDIKAPEIITTPLGYLSDTTTPFAMLSIGATIAFSDLRTVLSKRTAWITFLKLIVAPAISCVIFSFLIHDETMFLCFCVAAASPSAALVPVLTEEAGGDAAEASGVFLLSTIVSAITVPLFVLALTVF